MRVPAARARAEAPRGLDGPPGLNGPACRTRPGRSWPSSAASQLRDRDQRVEVDARRRCRCARAGRRRPRSRRCRSRPVRMGSRRGRRSRRRSRVAPASRPASRQASAVPRVSCRCRPAGLPGHAPRPRPAARAAPAPARRRRSCRRAGARPPRRRAMRAACSITTPGSTSPLNGQPNATLSVTLTSRPAACASAIRLSAMRAPSSTPAFWLRRPKASVSAYDVCTRSTPAASARSAPRGVERQPGELEAAVAERRHDLLGARHRGHPAGIDEARRLDAPEPGCGQPPAELGARRRREHDRVVLEAVARAHVAHQGSGHGRSLRRSRAGREARRVTPPRARTPARRHITLHIPR